MIARREGIDGPGDRMSRQAGSAVLSTATAPALGFRASVEHTPSIWTDAARRFLANRLAVFGLVIASIIVFCAIFADVLALTKRDYANFAEVLQFPSARHPLGTDAVGRDFYTRVLYGARTSMLVGFTAPLLATLIGVPLGALAGWYRGWFDFVLLRVIEILTALPSILVAILLVTIWGSGIEKLILYMAATGWVGGARFARAQFMALKEREYVLGARALGAGEARLMFYHVLPNAAGPIIVGVMTGIPGAIFGEAGLSFLGLGINDPIPSWGKMVAESQVYFQVYWHLAVVPTVLIALSMLAFTFVGDGLRDALDPYMER
jgi:oligopeptide transport system permease protein